jgi:hypothetical protein
MEKPRWCDSFLYQLWQLSVPAKHAPSTGQISMPLQGPRLRLDDGNNAHRELKTDGWSRGRMPSCCSKRSVAKNPAKDPRPEKMHATAALAGYLWLGIKQKVPRQERSQQEMLIVEICGWESTTGLKRVEIQPGDTA